MSIQNPSFPPGPERGRAPGNLSLTRLLAERRQAEERLAAFAEATFEGIIESEAGRILDCNEQFAEMTGYTAAELRGMAITDLIPSDDHSRVMANVRQSLDSVIEHTVLRKDGALVVVEAHGRPVFPGSATRYTVIRDITERKRAEEALRDSEERSRNIIRYAPAAIYEIDVAGERFRSVNETMCHLLGYDREELLALHPRDLLEEESRAAFLARIEKKLAGADVAESVEYRIRARDGRWIDGLVSIGPLSYKDGRPDSVLVITHDITPRKRIERLYAVLSRVNETIVRTHDEQALCRDVCRIIAQDGGFPLVWIGILNGRDVVPVASAGSAVGYLSEIKVEVDGRLGNGPTGRSVREDRSIINDDFDRNPLVEPWRQSALSHGFRASAAFPLHRSGQTAGALTLYAARPGAFDPEQTRLLEALSADVSYAFEAMDQERRRARAETALRESEQSLRESNRRKNEFLAMLSHELRNPLAPIQNSLHILERSAPGGDQAKRAQIIIERQVGQLSRLVDDLLDITRISRNKIRLERQMLDLNDLVRRTIEDHRWLFEKSEIHLEARFAPEGISVNADGARLAQVVANLLQNAAKFTGQGGSVTVTVLVELSQRQAVISRVGHGRRHVAGGARVPLPALRAGRDHPRSQQGRTRTWAGARERARRTARGRGHGQQSGTRPGIRVLRAASAVHDRYGRATGPGRSGENSAADPDYRGQRGRGGQSARRARTLRARGRGGVQRPRGDREGAGLPPRSSALRHRAARNGRL